MKHKFQYLVSKKRKATSESQTNTTKAILHNHKQTAISTASVKSKKYDD